MTESAHLDRFVIDRLPPRDLQPQFDLADYSYPPRLNAAVELLRGRGDALAIVTGHERWSYAALADRAARIAAVLSADGLVPGGRVLLRGPNSSMLFAAWLGVLWAGGVVVTTMPMLRSGELATLRDRADIGHAIVDAAGADAWHAVAERCTTRIYGGDGAYEARLAATAPVAACDTAADDPALIAFTSGTTGVPKGCIQFHRDCLIPADAFARHMIAPGPDDIFLCSAPIAFTFGLGASLLFPWRFGGRVAIVDRPTPQAMLDAIERHRVTVLMTAPTAYKTMLPELAGRDLSSLRACVSAGEHLPAAVSDAWFAATGLRPIDGIGATEMMHIFISAAGDAVRPGATGRAVPGYTATVLDPGGEPMAHGTGRLAVRGPTGCRYLDDPERQRGYVVGGWNVTGDTYRLDEDGCFWFVARSDDMIVSSGYNVAAPEVEAALYGHPAVAECAVVGAPCAARGMIVKAFVVAAAGHRTGDALAAELQAHVKATIAPYKYPRAIAFVEALPRTATGKLRRFELRG